MPPQTRKRKSLAMSLKTYGEPEEALGLLQEAQGRCGGAGNERYHAIIRELKEAIAERRRGAASSASPSGSDS